MIIDDVTPPIDLDEILVGCRKKKFFIKFNKLSSI